MKASQLFDVNGLAIIVTGAGSGIGLAYAEAMADNGARVTLLDRDAKSLDAAVRRLSERGGDVRGQVVDVTDRPALRASINGAAEHYGKLDVAFANVGIDSPPGFLGMTGQRTFEGAFENVSDERWDLVMATNLTSIYSTIKAAVPHMKKNAKGGRIIVTTSVAGIRPEAIVGTCRPRPRPRISFIRRRSNWRNTISWSMPSRRVPSLLTSPAGTCRTRRR
jgi:NAD(P)-dependent dehydrogenase (short-subunit alcohol dehydrogenase family)